MTMNEIILLQKGPMFHILRISGGIIGNIFFTEPIRVHCQDI